MPLVTRRSFHTRFQSNSVLIGSVALASLAGLSCASQPTAAELSAAITSAAASSDTAEVTIELSQCIAEQLLASDLSDTTLSGLAQDFANPKVLSTEQAAIPIVLEEANSLCESQLAQS